MALARDEDVDDDEDASRPLSADLEERVDEALDGEVASVEDVEDAFLSE